MKSIFDWMISVKNNLSRERMSVTSARMRARNGNTQERKFKNDLAQNGVCFHLG